MARSSWDTLYIRDCYFSTSFLLSLFSLLTHCDLKGYLLHLIRLNAHTHTKTNIHIHKHTHKFGRTPLDEESSRRRNRSLTTHNTHKRHIHAAGGIRTRNPVKRVAVTHPLDYAATGSDLFIFAVNVLGYCSPLAIYCA